jgi:hypothetical protein
MQAGAKKLIKKWKSYNHEFLILVTDPGLKAHQSPCDWASGSLEIAILFNDQFWQQEVARSEKNKRKICKRRNLNSKIEQETFIHCTSINKMSQIARIPEEKHKEAPIESVCMIDYLKLLTEILIDQILLINSCKVSLFPKWSLLDVCEYVCALNCSA